MIIDIKIDFDWIWKLNGGNIGTDDLKLLNSESKRDPF